LVNRYWVLKARTIGAWIELGETKGIARHPSPHTRVVWLGMVLQTME
jgi:hypothetical protein